MGCFPPLKALGKITRIPARRASFEVAIFPQVSYSYSDRALRVRVPPMAEYEYENTGFLITTKSIQAEIAQLQNAQTSEFRTVQVTHWLARRAGIVLTATRL